MHSPTSYQAFIKEEFSTFRTLFVSPRPQPNRDQTDYLTLFYKNLEENGDVKYPKLHYLSAVSFWKLIFISKPSITLLHYHWLEFQSLKSAFGLFFKWVCMALFRFRGGTVIWTVHNLHPHQGKWIGMNESISRSMSKVSTHVLIHCKEVAELVKDTFQIQEHKLRIIPHPVYPLQRLSFEESVRHLNLVLKHDFCERMPTFLFFGQISAYKQIPQTVEWLAELPQNFRIVIAGKVLKENKVEGDIVDSLDKNYSNVFFYNRALSDRDIQALFSISDAVILNYRAILDSGVFHLARSLETHIIARGIGCFQEWNKTAGVSLFDSKNEFIEHIQRIVLHE